MTDRADRAARPLLIPVADLRAGECRSLELSVSLDGLGLSSAWIEPDAAIDLELTVEGMSSGFTVMARMRTVWVGECRRCLEPVRGLIDVEAREVFSPDPVDEEIHPVDDERLDLEPVVREAILLELPLSPLCSEACSGPTGQPEPASAGSGPDPDPRWAALSELDFGPSGPDEG